jgi:hypothetical protein
MRKAPSPPQTLALSDVDSLSAAVAEEAQDDDTPAAGTPETGFHGLKAVVRDPTVPYYGHKLWW